MSQSNSTSSLQTSIAICGAGPVGQALALLLHQQGIAAKDILLLDAKTSAQSHQDARSIALSHGSFQMLDNLHAAPRRTTAITQIHVSRRHQFGRTLIKASDYELPALGYVVRYGDIIAPLEIALNNAGILIKRPIQVQKIEDTESEKEVEIQLQDNTHYKAAIVIQAEGGNFAEQSPRLQHREYQQSALIAHITVSHPVLNQAYERFTEHGPIALLPQDDGYALVWCLRPEVAENNLQMNDKEFLNALQHAFGERLGQFVSTSKRAIFPLGLNAQTQAGHRTVKIGNAAQTLHPVAGQGLNLGLRDAFVLAQCLGVERTPQAIARFLQLRNTDRNASIHITDTMANIFTCSADQSALQSILGFSLSIIDLLPPVKKRLAEQMMYGWR